MVRGEVNRTFYLLEGWERGTCPGVLYLDKPLDVTGLAHIFYSVEVNWHYYYITLLFPR